MRKAEFAASLFPSMGEDLPGRGSQTKRRKPKKSGGYGRKQPKNLRGWEALYPKPKRNINQ